jgi:hypothetical protein
MSLSSIPLFSSSRPKFMSTEQMPDPPDERAMVAVLAHPSASDAHDRLVAGLPGRSIRTWSSSAAEGVVDELAHRDMVRFASRGALTGSVALGAITLAIAMSAASQPLGVGAGLGAAVALTGGVFVGGLMGFFLAVMRWEDAHASVRSHRRHRRSLAVLIVEGDFDPQEARRILRHHDATVVDTGLT